MALCNQSPPVSLFRNPNLPNTRKLSPFSTTRCSRNSPPAAEDDAPKNQKRLSKQSSWEAKDSEGRDYLYRLGKEADNMNIAVGARSGVIDDLFAGNFLGRDCKNVRLCEFFSHWKIRRFWFTFGENVEDFYGWLYRYELCVFFGS